MRYLGRRLVSIPIVFVVIAAITYAMPRVLRPQLYGDEGVVSGTVHDLGRVFLHFDLGRACGWRGCPDIHEMWSRGALMDLSLLLGALAIGILGGAKVGGWCARNPRSRLAQVVQAGASVTYCAPVYFVGLGLLYLFNPIFGRWPVPAFFDAEPTWATPFGDPWHWFRMLLVPCLVVAAPLAAMCVRLTLGLTADAMAEDYIRTAIAKGIPRRQVSTRHAAPAAYVSTASFVAISIPLVVSNMVLIERVLSVPGFFRYTFKASGHTQSPIPDPVTDFPMLQALTLWGAVLILVAGLLVDLALVWLDPRIRTAE